MFAITAKYVPVYNSVEKKTGQRHWRQLPHGRHVFASPVKIECETLKIKELQEKIAKYEDDNKKLKMFVSWTLKNSQTMMEILEE